MVYVPGAGGVQLNEVEPASTFVLVYFTVAPCLMMILPVKMHRLASAQAPVEIVIAAVVAATYVNAAFWPGTVVVAVPGAPPTVSVPPLASAGTLYRLTPTLPELPPSGSMYTLYVPVEGRVTGSRQALPWPIEYEPGASTVLPNMSEACVPNSAPLLIELFE